MSINKIDRNDGINIVRDGVFGEKITIKSEMEFEEIREQFRYLRGSPGAWETWYEPGMLNRGEFTILMKWQQITRIFTVGVAQGSAESLNEGTTVIVRVRLAIYMWFQLLIPLSILIAAVATIWENGLNPALIVFLLVAIAYTAVIVNWARNTVKKMGEGIYFSILYPQKPSQHKSLGRL